MILRIRQCKTRNSLQLMDKDEEETKDPPSIELSLDETILLTQQLLTDLIEAEGYESESIFNSDTLPSIPFGAFLRRIHKFTRYSPQCLIIAIIYLDKYNLINDDFHLNWFNVYKLFLTCLVLAVKFQDDVYFDNCSFEKASGVSTCQIMQFEMEVFQKLGFSAFVTKQQFENLAEKLLTVYTTQ